MAAWCLRRRAIEIVALLLLGEMLSIVTQISTAQDFESSGELPYEDVMCPSNLSCSDESMPAVCLFCNFTSDCVYGRNTTVSCRPRDDVDCEVCVWVGSWLLPLCWCDWRGEDLGGAVICYSSSNIRFPLLPLSSRLCKVFILALYFIGKNVPSPKLGLTKLGWW